MPHYPFIFSVALAVSQLVGSFNVHEVSAHPAPQAFQHVSAGDGTSRALSFSRGIAIDPMGDGDWRYICSEAAGLASQEKPDVIALRGGDYLLATSQGLRRGSADGCRWDKDDGPLGNETVQALIAHPKDPSILWAVTASRDTENGVYRSMDEGNSWTKVESLPVDSYLSSLAVSPQSTSHFCAVGFTLDPERFQAQYFLLCGDGEERQRAEIATTEDDLDVSIVAVHPQDANRIYLLYSAYSSAQKGDRLIESRDGGETFAPIFAAKDIHSVALSAEGSTLWVGEATGLWTSSDEGESFAKSPTEVPFSCLRDTPDGLLACSEHSVEAFAVGISLDEGLDFAPILQFSDIDALPECESNRHAICAEDWLDWKEEILTPIVSEESPATAPDGEPADRHPESETMDAAPGETGCTHTPSPAGPRSAWSIVALFAFLLLRHRHPQSVQERP